MGESVLNDVSRAHQQVKKAHLSRYPNAKRQHVLERPDGFLAFGQRTSADTSAQYQVFLPRIAVKENHVCGEQDTKQGCAFAPSKASKFISQGSFNQHFLARGAEGLHRRPLTICGQINAGWCSCELVRPIRQVFRQWRVPKRKSSIIRSKSLVLGGTARPSQAKRM